MESGKNNVGSLEKEYYGTIVDGCVTSEQLPVVLRGAGGAGRAPGKQEQ